MPRILLAAMAALAVLAARPSLAHEEGCQNCPHHKAAQAEKGYKKDAKVACPCVAEGKECKCGPNCQCPHCASKKAAEKKQAPTKT